MQQQLWTLDQQHRLMERLADTETFRINRKALMEVVEELAEERPRPVAVLQRRMTPGATYDDVAPEFGVTRERVRQIEAKMLRILRHPLRTRRYYYICPLDWDGAQSVSHDSEDEPVDTIYLDAAQGRDGGWYLSIDLDCNSGGFTETLDRDDGPYDSREDALRAGLDAAVDWLSENWPEDPLPGADCISADLRPLAHWLGETEEKS